MLPAAPVGTREEMGGKSSDPTRRSVPAFPRDILDHAVGRKGGDHPCDVAGIHAPHILRQGVVDRVTLFQAYIGRIPRRGSGPLNTLCLRSRAAQPFQLCSQAGVFSFQSLGAGVLSFCTSVRGRCRLFRRWHHQPTGGKRA
jgi:hypothetical protein